MVQIHTPLPIKKSESINMNFGDALEHIQKGFEVCRSGWNGKSMFLRLVNDWNGVVGELPTDAKLLPWIGMKTADNSFVPWLASQSDLLANDWILL